jgi:hypothetical protein
MNDSSPNPYFVARLADSVGKLYVMNTTKLKRFCEAADLHGYNQRPLLDNVLKSGKHLIYCILSDHTNAEGKVSVRCVLMMKMKGKKEPAHGLIDINRSEWSHFIAENHVLGGYPPAVAAPAVADLEEDPQ